MNAPAHGLAKDRTGAASQRPQTLDYIERVFTDCSEIHGDRGFGDDPALVCGMARFHGEEVLVVGTQKGRDMKQRVYRNFGTPHPDGYRKALRVMQVAEKFRRPIFTLVDTDGAYPGIHAEERGQAEAIAHNLREMARLEVPIIATVIGVGGQRRRIGDRRCRPRADDGELDLLSDFTRGLRRHHVARCDQEGTGGGSHAHYGYRPQRTGLHRRYRSRARGRSAPGSRSGGEFCSMSACRSTYAELKGTPAVRVARVAI